MAFDGVDYRNGLLVRKGNYSSGARATASVARSALQTSYWYARRRQLIAHVPYMRNGVGINMYTAILCNETSYSELLRIPIHVPPWATRVEYSGYIGYNGGIYDGTFYWRGKLVDNSFNTDTASSTNIRVAQEEDAALSGGKVGYNTFLDPPLVFGISGHVDFSTADPTDMPGWFYLEAYISQGSIHYMPLSINVYWSTDG